MAAHELSTVVQRNSIRKSFESFESMFLYSVLVKVFLFFGDIFHFNLKGAEVGRLQEFAIRIFSDLTPFPEKRWTPSACDFLTTKGPSCLRG